jgi:hypothetical protein
VVRDTPRTASVAVAGPEVPLTVLASAAVTTKDMATAATAVTFNKECINESPQSLNEDRG